MQIGFLVCKVGRVNKTLTDADLNEIERRAQHHHLDGGDVLALIAEVRRLREETARLRAQISVPPDHGEQTP